MHRRHKETFYRKGYTDADKHMKRCSTSLALREIQIKTTVDIFTQLPAWLKWKIVILRNAGEDIEKLDHSYITAGNVECYSHSGKQFEVC